MSPYQQSWEWDGSCVRFGFGGFNDCYAVPLTFGGFGAAGGCGGHEEVRRIVPWWWLLWDLLRSGLVIFGGIPVVGFWSRSRGVVLVFFCFLSFVA